MKRVNAGLLRVAPSILVNTFINLFTLKTGISAHSPFLEHLAQFLGERHLKALWAIPIMIV